MDMEVTDKELMRKRKPTSIKQVPRKETDGSGQMGRRKSMTAM